jgi:hypothetical protein
MQDTILEIIQDLCARANLPKVLTINNTSDATVRHFLALAHLEGAELVSKYDWEQLIRTFTITLEAGKEAYSLPNDFARQIMRTYWDVSNNWRIAPIEASQWTGVKSSLIQTNIYNITRFWTWNKDQVYIHPVPTAGDAGKQLKFEYLSQTWIKPTDWQASKQFETSSRCWYEGNVYEAVGGGNCGSTPPTHTTGTVSDGNVSWLFVQSYGYTRFITNTDLPLIDSTLIALGIRLRYEKEMGFDFTYTEKEYQERLNRETSSLKGLTPFGFAGSYSDIYNIPLLPDGNWII